MKTIFSIFLVSLLIGFSGNILAHEGHHADDNDTLQKSTVMADSLKNIPNEANTQTPTGFATLHPLVVHFPIVLLIIAALLQLIGLFYSKNNWDYITLFLLAAGALGAYLSGSFFHPHTEGLTHEAHKILERHELFASLTLISSVVALLLKVVAMYVFKSKKRLFEILTALMLLFSAVSVSFAGHWGAYLTHIEGVGPQGKFIEIE
jgi:uncharacterized membrane protein